VLAAAGALVSPAGGVRAQLLITGNDEKVRFDPATGKTVNQAPGKDTVSIIDIHDPIKPRILANLPLMNRSSDLRSISRSLPISIWRWSPIRSTGSKTARAGRACRTTRSM
jgi:hypothetical protein